MKEHPILFSGPMVRAILDGRKTQTRRIMKHQPPSPSYKLFTPGDERRHWIHADGVNVIDGGQPYFKCPYGQPGDRLWVRETWQSFGDSSKITPPVPYSCQVRYEADGATVWLPVPTGARGVFPASLKSRPSIFMPRWAARITLQITGVRVERLQDISEHDALAEGVNYHILSEQAAEFVRGKSHLPPAVLKYGDLWESINGHGSWDANPYVWVVEFASGEGPPFSRPESK